MLQEGREQEDLPKHFAIIQGKNEDETILLDRGSLIDDSDVAEPKKSNGFFGWLMGD